MKYLKLLPLIIYPYAYLIYLIAALLTPFETVQTLLIEGLLPAIIVYTLLTLVISIRNIVHAVKGQYTAAETSRMNMLVKGLHIPAYIFHFVMGVLGLCMSVWGIGFILVAVVVDVITIALSGVNAISCAVCMKKEKQLPTVLCVLTAIGSMIFCADVVIAIVWFVKCRIRKQQPVTM